MNAQELFVADGKSAGVFYCSECRIVHRTKEQADECCDRRCSDCGAKLENYYIRCKECQDKVSKAAEQKAYEEARKITEAEYDEPLVLGYYDGDEFDSCIEDVLDGAYCRADNVPFEEIDDLFPKFVWGVKPVPFPKIDSNSIIEYFFDEYYSDNDDYYPNDFLEGLDELDEALEAFYNLNVEKKNFIYTLDKTTVIMVDEEERQEWITHVKLERANQD